MNLISFKSSNYSKKARNKGKIKFLIIHYTGMQSVRASINRLTNPRYKVSCHYLIDRKGKIFQMVEDNKIAWHAGKSKWQKLNNLNDSSIGIELANKGHRYGYQAFTKSQIKKLIQLCKNLKKKYMIKNKFILGHSDVAPLRKIDPGEKFPWDYMHSKGVGIYPGKIRGPKKSLKNVDIQIFLRNLYKIGYRYLKKKFKKKIIKNFQRKFRQKKVDGVLDSETMKISEILAKKSNIA